jgi:hypothetical protein
MRRLLEQRELLAFRIVKELGDLHHRENHSITVPNQRKPKFCNDRRDS